MLDNSSFLLSNTEMLKFSKNGRQFIFKMLSFRLNIKPYNRLNKKVADFKEHKNRLVILCITKYFHHQNEEDADNNKKCKTHT